VGRACRHARQLCKPCRSDYYRAWNQRPESYRSCVSTSLCPELVAVTSVSTIAGVDSISLVISLVYGRVAASLNGDEWALQARDDGSRSTDAIR
jgi:hypothetical protein